MNSLPPTTLLQTLKKKGGGENERKKNLVGWLIIKVYILSEDYTTPAKPWITVLTYSCNHLCRLVVIKYSDLKV